MNKNTKIIVWLVIIIVVICALLYLFKKNESNTAVTIDTPSTSDTDIKGCYVAKLGKDVYNLKIDSENEGKVSGMLAYNNYQKDSSSGEFTGTFNNDILLGNYIFNSEGMQSNRQVIFKKVGNSFIQ